MTTYEAFMAAAGNALQRAAERRARRRALREQAQTAARRGVAPALQVLGLGFLDFAAYQWIPLVGFVAIGLSLLVVGEQVKT